MTWRLPLCAMVPLFALAAPASAAPAEVGLQLRAEVASFCRIYTDESAVGSDGRIGAVRELCNSAAGYGVQASFSNLRGGTVRAGEEEQDLSADGSALFVSSMARHRTRDWALLSAQRLDAGQPVTVRFTISPL